MNVATLDLYQLFFSPLTLEVRARDEWNRDSPTNTALIPPNPPERKDLTGETVCFVVSSLIRCSFSNCASAMLSGRE